MHKVANYYVINQLDAGGEADDGEEQPRRVEVLENPLHRHAVDPERDGGLVQVQAAADHLARVKQEGLPRPRNRNRLVVC